MLKEETMNAQSTHLRRMFFNILAAGIIAASLAGYTVYATASSSDRSAGEVPTSASRSLPAASPAPSSAPASGLDELVNILTEAPTVSQPHPIIHRLERPAWNDAGANRFERTGLLCPFESTAYGERDAGASSPVPCGVR
jgi:hypothetical protein